VLTKGHNLTNAFKSVRAMLIWGPAVPCHCLIASAPMPSQATKHAEIVAVESYIADGGSADVFTDCNL
jgi:hypothetical protein